MELFRNYLETQILRLNFTKNFKGTIFSGIWLNSIIFKNTIIFFYNYLINYNKIKI